MMSSEERSPYVVGIGGTTREGSSSECALRYALKVCEARGAQVRAFTGHSLQFPFYEYGVQKTSDCSDFINAVRRADGLIIASPAYHGLMPGLLKNALDYLEELAGDTRPYLDGRAVGCIVVAKGAQALGSTLNSLRSSIHALRGWPTPYAAAVTLSSSAFVDGAPVGAAEKAALEIVAQQVIDQCRARQFLIGAA